MFSLKLFWRWSQKFFKLDNTARIYVVASAALDFFVPPRSLDYVNGLVTIAYAVPAGDRTFVVAGRATAFTVAAGDRSFAVPASDRTFDAPLPG